MSGAGRPLLLAPQAGAAGDGPGLCPEAAGGGAGGPGGGGPASPPAHLGGTLRHRDRPRLHHLAQLLVHLNRPDRQVANTQSVTQSVNTCDIF